MAVSLPDRLRIMHPKLDAHCAFRALRSSMAFGIPPLFAYAFVTDGGAQENAEDFCSTEGSF